jgi:bifunctional UDP-N-acetylglucosamine pyrophosphorylase/glucosamine-1-phosphate N-acetyltransferase
MATSAPTSLKIAILAAGVGKRMRSGLPKVLHPLGGRPLLAHVIETSRKLAPQRICVVFGHGGDQVRARFPDSDLQWALQDPPLGTGHALAQALPQLGTDGVTLVLFGADPLARPETLDKVVGHARSGALSLLTIELDDPTGYGRHRARRRSQGHGDRRAQGRDAGAAQDSRDQHRRDGGAHGIFRALAQGGRQRQRERRVLPDRRDRDGAQGRRADRGRRRRAA